MTTSRKPPERAMSAMTPDEIEAAANRDPDNRPLSSVDLARMKRTPQVKIIRRALGLSQDDFADQYKIPIGTLRDWEQGRAKPDQAARAYLTIIAQEPETVRKVLHGPHLKNTSSEDMRFAIAMPHPDIVEPSILLGDRPIKTESEDIFGLSSFADALAKSLTEMAPDEGLVISVEGEWGSGKTSALELAQRRIIIREMAKELDKSIDHIEKRSWSEVEAEWEALVESRRTHVIRFNPWNFSGQENLVKAFFAEVGIAIGHPTNSAISRAVRKITDCLPSAGAIIGTGVGAISGGLATTGVGGALGRATGEGLQRTLENKETLETAKQQLGNALRDAKKRIIAIIDDLDRLSPSEMRAVFSLVKSLGDLPNVLYVLAFDRSQVVTALQSGMEPIPGDFLNKIVQVTLKLPPPWHAEIIQLFYRRVNSIIGDAKPNDPERWRRAFYDSVAPFLRTPRDVARLSNALQVIWPNVVGDVDLTDLIVLTTLQLFEPTVYDVLFSNIESLAGEVVTLEDDKIFAARFEIEGKANLPSASKKALGHLFPRLARGWSLHFFDGTVHLRKREQRRICTEEYYRNYFLFGRDPERVSRAELERALTDENPRRRIEAIVARLSKERSRRGVSKIATFLDQLLEVVFAKPLLSDDVVRAILDISDGLIERDDVVWEIAISDNLDRISHILTMGLEPLSEDGRLARVGLMSNHPNGLTVSALAIDRLAGQHGLYGGRDRLETDKSIPLEAAEEAVSIVLKRIRELARRSEDFLSTPKPAQLIWIWQRWTSLEEIRSQLSEWMNSDDAVLRLAEVLPSISYKSSSMGTMEVLTFNSRIYEPIIDVVNFKKRLDAITAKFGRESKAERIRSQFLAAEEAGKRQRF